MKVWRVAWRASVMGLLTLGWASAFLLGLPVAKLLGRAEAWRGRVFGGWARATARVIGMQIEREGVPPRGPVLLVSNHLGYVDIVLIASQMRCVFLSKAEVERWPGVGLLTRWMQTLFVDRALRRDVQRVAAEMRARLARGQSVVFFPEGTSTAGEGVRAFHSALLEPAAREAWPVSHAALRYFTPPGSPAAAQAVAWWGDARFGAHLLRLLALPGFRARIAFGAEPLRDSDRKSLALRLHERVASRFASLLESEERCPLGA